MESLMSAVAPRSPAPAKKLSEVDFRSGATLEQLSAQVSELVVLEQGEFGDQTALEVHTAKDFIFNMLGMSAIETLIYTPFFIDVLPHCHFIKTTITQLLWKERNVGDEMQWNIWSCCKVTHHILSLYWGITN